MIKDQLELLGIETLREGALSMPDPRSRRRKLKQIETAHEVLSEVPSIEDLSFLHSGLCQTCLPHRRPAKNSTIWKRTSGRFTLMVTPGALSDDDLSALREPANDGPVPDPNELLYVGVPYGPKARLIMIYLQTEGIKGRFVSLGPSLSAFMRSLGLAVTGGERGTINAVREQSLRIARCSFTMQWTDLAASGATRTVVTDSKIVEGLEFWRDLAHQDWNGTVELSDRFYNHLRDHAVPLDKRGIALLAGNSLGLDLYALFAYRLPRLKEEILLRWAQLQAQIGADVSETFELARRIRDTLPVVLSAYPDAKVEITRSGLLVRPSNPAVPRTMVQGYRLLGRK